MKSENKNNKLVIETSILYDNFLDIRDSQSRIIEIDSWVEYIKRITNGDIRAYAGKLGTLSGYTPSIYDDDWKKIGKIILEDPYHIIYKKMLPNGGMTVHTSYLLDGDYHG